MSTEMFEKASRCKLRFDSNKGQVSTEDLWDIPLTRLNEVAVGLHKQLKESTETVSFITPTVSKDTELQLKFDVAKHIIGIRVAERDAAKEASERKAKKQQLLEILDRKKNEELQGKSVEELSAMINAL